MTISSAGEDVKKLDLLYAAYGDAKKIHTTQQLYSWVFISEIWNMCTQYSVHDCYCSFICNCPKLETIKMSFNEWMTKLTVTLPYYRILLSQKIKINNKNELLTQATAWMHLKGIMLSKDHILYASIYNILRMTKSEWCKADWWMPGSRNGRGWGLGVTLKR